MHFDYPFQNFVLGYHIILSEDIEMRTGIG